MVSFRCKAMMILKNSSVLVTIAISSYKAIYMR